MIPKFRLESELVSIHSKTDMKWMWKFAGKQSFWIGKQMKSIIMNRHNPECKVSRILAYWCDWCRAHWRSKTVVVDRWETADVLQTQEGSRGARQLCCQLCFSSEPEDMDS